RRFLVGAQDVHPGLLLVMVHGELNVVLAAAPVGHRAIVRAGPVAVRFLASLAFLVGLGVPFRGVLAALATAQRQSQRGKNGQAAPQQSDAFHTLVLQSGVVKRPFLLGRSVP